MSQQEKMNRRQAIKLGFGTAVTLLGSKLLAGDPAKQDCQPTPPEQAGPFYPNKPQPDRDLDLTVVHGAAERAEGEVIIVKGRILDEDCQPIAGVLVEIWQANKWGRYHHEADTNPAKVDPNFQGWGQMVTNANGEYRFKTIVPGPYPATPEWTRAPHIHFKVSRRGYHELITQMYFDGHPLNKTDLLINAMAVPEVQKLIVKFYHPADEPEQDTKHGTFDIHLQKVV